jgi:uncharacterized protein (DUF1499 family)
MTAEQTHAAPPAAAGAANILRWLWRALVVVTVLAAAAVVLAGPLYKFGILGLPKVFPLLQNGAKLAGIGAILSLLGLVPKISGGGTRGIGLAVVGVVAGGLAFFIPYKLLQVAKTVPPIHDITTDTENPPQFKAVLPLRATAPNKTDYPEKTKLQQLQGYPDLATLELKAPAAEVQTRAVAAAKQLGWELVESAPDEGRVEATATTAWFGFKDDVVIRIVEEGDVTKLDIRSESRVGGSDLGANAARIRDFLKLMKS